MTKRGVPQVCPGVSFTGDMSPDIGRLARPPAIRGLRCAYRRHEGSDPASDKEPKMADKSPRQHMSKKTGKSLKEKRAEKHAKADAKSKIEIVPPGKKH